MAKDKKGFLLYADQKELFTSLSDEQAGKLIKHILRYVNDESPELNDPVLKIAFVPIKQQLKRDLVKYEEVREKRSKAGKASAEARKKQQMLTSVESVQQDSTKSTDKGNVNDSVNVNVKDNVILSNKQIAALKDKHSDEAYEWMIDKLSNYKLSSGKKYKSDYGAINSWVVKEWEKQKPKKKTYDVTEGFTI